MGQPQLREHAHRSSEFRWDVGRDATAAVLLVVALLLPWNLSFGLGVPGSSPALFVLLLIATLFASAGLIATYAGHRGTRSVTPGSSGPRQVRLALSMPYLLVVVGFVGFGFVQSLRFGGTGDVPPGVGPGLLTGIAGALLAAQPPLRGGGEGPRPDRWVAATRVIGVVAAAMATVSVLAIMYWRNRYPVQAIAEGIHGPQNVAVIAATVVYGVVPWVAVLVGVRWAMSDHVSSRMATVALGCSTLLGSALVWILGVGRDVDAYHGVAQTTATVSVGFEGYVGWAAVAAIVGTATLRTVFKAPVPLMYWGDAGRSCLSLIVVWCLGSALRRIVDLIVAVSLDMPFSAYDSIALMAFDIVAAVAALWIRFNARNNGLLPALLTAAAGVLSVLMVCRVVVGVGLAPRILYAPEPEGLRDAVYGNMLEQQITSTFDVVLCALALAVTAMTVVMQRATAGAAVTGQSSTKLADATPGRDDDSAERTVAISRHAVPTAAFPTESVPTVAGPDAPQHGQAGPRIARASGNADHQDVTGRDREPRIKRVLQESTQRFGAGTTYSGPGPTQPPRQG